MHTSLLMAAVCCALPLAAAAQDGSAGDEAAVRGVVKAYVDARERRDAGAIRALFTETADQLTSSGEWRRGRDQIVRGALASSSAHPGTRTIEVETMRFPAPGVAIADGRYEIAGAGAGGVRRMWTTFVMIRAGGVWRIAAIRNMLPAPARTAPPQARTNARRGRQAPR